jgi:hypothetical protein
MHCIMSDIFESPDGGKMIYVRESGSSERKLVVDNRTVDGRPLHDHIMESKLWGEIHRAAKTNKTLADILEQAKMVYALIKKETN